MSQASPQEKEKLVQARDLIANKDYTRARTILYTFPPNHPIAQKWLAKLDELAPPPKMSTGEYQLKFITDPNITAAYETDTSVITGSTSGRASGRYVQKKKMDKRRSIVDLQDPMAAIQLGARPENPFWIDVANISIPFLPGAIKYLFIYLAYNTGLAYNWGNLGRPKWSTPTLLVSITLSVLTFGSLAGLTASFTSPEFAKYNLELYFMVFIPMLCVLDILFPLSVAATQYGGYLKWANHQDIQGMYHYRYPIEFLVVLWLFLCLGCPILAIGGIQVANRPVIQDHGAYTVGIKQLAWTEVPFQTPICADPRVKCIREITPLGTASQVSLLFYQEQLDRRASVEALNENYWRDINGAARVTGANPIKQYSARVGGQAGFVHEFYAYQANNPFPTYNMVVYVPYNGQMVGFYAVFEDQLVFEQEKGLVLDVLDTVKFE